MPDETTSNPAPVDTAIPQASETLNPTPPEVVIASTPAEAPVAPVLTPEPIAEMQTAQMGGNEPFELASRGKARPPQRRHLIPSPINLFAFYLKYRLQL